MKKFEDSGVFLVRDKQTNKPLYFVWKFIDQSSQRVAYDPQNEWCILLEKSIREEHAQHERHRRHRANFFRGMELDIEDIPEEEADEFDDDDLIPEKFVSSFLATLTETQLRRYNLKAKHPKYTYTKIAELEGVDVTSVRECFLAIQKKYKKYITKNTPK